MFINEREKIMSWDALYEFSKLYGPAGVIILGLLYVIYRLRLESIDYNKEQEVEFKAERDKYEASFKAEREKLTSIIAEKEKILQDEKDRRREEALRIQAESYKIMTSVSSTLQNLESLMLRQEKIMISCLRGGQK